MSFERDVRGLQKMLWLGQVALVGVLLFGVIGVLLFFEPALVGVPDSQTAVYQGQHHWLLTGIFFILFALYFLLSTGKWQRRLVWIWQTVSPRSMRARLEVVEDSDSTSYFANLVEDEAAATAEKWRISLYRPSWDVSALVDMETAVRVYFDPESRQPAVIEMEPGLLWRMAGNGAVHSDEPS